MARPSRKWYSSKRWQDRRRRQLQAEPLCRYHKSHGELVEATVADHIIPHKDDAGQFWHGDLQSLCKHCHDSLKQRQEHGKLTQGCTEDGIPLDSGHHWS